MSHLTLDQRLVQIKKKIEGNMPPRFLEIMHKSTRDLESSGIQNKIVQVGEKAPMFTLPDESDQLVNSQDLLNDAPLVLTFYRGFWCSYCNADLFYLNKCLPEINELGAKLVGISPELAQYSRKIIAMQKLNFPILTDQGNKVAEEYRVKWALQQDLKELYRDSFSMNLKLYHGDDDWTLPMPARFLIDQDGIVRYSEASADYRKRPDPADLLSAISSL